METPDVIDLRKTQRKEAEPADRPLYTVRTLLHFTRDTLHQMRRQATLHSKDISHFELYTLHFAPHEPTGHFTLQGHFRH